MLHWCVPAAGKCKLQVGVSVGVDVLEDWVCRCECMAITSTLTFNLSLVRSSGVCLLTAIDPWGLLVYKQNVFIEL